MDYNDYYCGVCGNREAQLHRLQGFTVSRCDDCFDVEVESEQLDSEE